MQRNMIDAQGRYRAFCQQQETTDAKQSLHDGTSGFETNSANIKLPKFPYQNFRVNHRLSGSVFGTNLQQE